MGQVTATAETTLGARPDVVLGALGDYTSVRPKILTDRYSAYEVLEGGVGDGTVVTWRLQATEKRVRHVVADVTTTADSVVEADRNSTMVTTYRVIPAGGGSKVLVTTTWAGASGVGGFFERMFAPKGLRAIHEGVLANLVERLGG